MQSQLTRGRQHTAEWDMIEISLPPRVRSQLDAAFRPAACQAGPNKLALQQARALTQTDSGISKQIALFQIWLSCFLWPSSWVHQIECAVLSRTTAGVWLNVTALAGGLQSTCYKSTKPAALTALSHTQATQSCQGAHHHWLPLHA